MSNYSSQYRAELCNSILSFWNNRMQDPRGGFYGQIDGDGNLVPDAAKGAILNARILWTFSSAYRVTKDAAFLELATRAKEYILAHFVDKKNGGIYWSLTSEGEPLDTKKQFYAIAFAVYGFAEYYRACGDEAALQTAKELYRSIEEHSYDPEFGGYIEAMTCTWEPIGDMRLSEKDQNDAKTMNTHLHILEAYTGLYRVWKDEVLSARLKELILIFLDKITAPNGHLQLFFDEKWNLHGEMVSYGHDIEASWLLCEAAEVLGDEAVLCRTKEVCKHIAEAAMEGFSAEGGMIYEYDPATGHLDSDRHWWVQAETVVGCRNMLQITGDKKWEEAEKAAWEFIRRDIVCPDGEWYWSRKADGSANTTDDRAGFWKCPYHNGRMCLEMIERLGAE